jgi:hypothetical protein
VVSVEAPLGKVEVIASGVREEAWIGVDLETVGDYQSGVRNAV